MRFSPWPTAFKIYMPFRDNCMKWPKMTLKTDFEVKCALYNLLVPINEFQILMHFTLRPAIFELIEIIVMNDHRMTLNTTRSKVCVLLVPQVSKFKSILPNDEPLWSYMPFWDKCTEWPQSDLERWGQRHRIYVLPVAPAPKFQSLSL